MKGQVSETVREEIQHARALYHRLVLLVGEEGHGKTSALREVALSTGAPLVNVNLELSLRMLDIAEWHRPRHAESLLQQIVAESGGEVVLLDNIELLFDVALELDPLRLLQGLSRNTTVVAAWNGSIKDGHLLYALPGHPEYKRYSLDGIVAVGTGGTEQ